MSAVIKTISSITNVLQKNERLYHAVVAFDAAKDKLMLMNFTAANTQLTGDILNNTNTFTQYIHNELQKAGCKYGIGGYDEHRTIYTRSDVFNNDKKTAPFGQHLEGGEPRRLHLGIDIWGAEGTQIFAPLGGMVHSFAYNDAYGDYGATIILLHQLEGLPFYTLYGHLQLDNIKNLREGQYINRGQIFAHFGKPEENGYWPPHVHFQVIADMQYMQGDYPGVCKFSERQKYLANCPNPDVILNMMQFAKPYSGG